MTNRDAINLLEEVKILDDTMYAYNPKYLDALDMALTALEAEETWYATHEYPQKTHWIPCSERLPEEHESVWAKAKGTDRWSEAMWEKQSDEVIVTELFEDGTTRTDTACTHDGEWYVKVKIVKRKIIAWMPLPEPYKRGEEYE